MQKNTTKQIKIDFILMKIITLESNLSKDSTAHDRLVVKSKQGVLLNQIKDIDIEIYKNLVP